uniref:Uncharacterized protein n=1 Tax=Anopheles albimanus TaxID=7167 RepID=A0A182F8J5_ANOAL
MCLVEDATSQPPQAVPEIITADHSQQQSSFVQRLRYWALNTNQTHDAVNGLLAVLRSGPAPVHLLARTTRTLLKTSRTATLRIYTVPGSTFWYRGIKKSLSHVLRKLQGPTTISLNVNIDGMLVFRSSATQFWPMLNVNKHSREAKDSPASNSDFLRPNKTSQSVLAGY